jgi:transposase-like protein
MTTSRVEVITSVERRRRWPQAEKERLVALSLEPGACASEIARSAGLHVSQLFRWRKRLCERIAPDAPTFLPVMVEPSADGAPAPSKARHGASAAHAVRIASRSNSRRATGCGWRARSMAVRCDRCLPP